ncbi:hypothetical protein IKG60_01250 [Candidatus Saccharibacteria bacterium]|nr:hypothetical protein [Candidatus Saccharibacteria bacterium]
MKKFVCAILVAVMMTMLAIPAYAATYSDVTPSKLGTKNYDAIMYIESFKGWKGLAKNGKLYPNKYITRQQFLQVLYNLYRKKVPADIFDVVHGNYIVTEYYLTQKCVELAKALKHNISWAGDKKKKMMRKDVARLLEIFCKHNSKFVPKK